MSLLTVSRHFLQRERELAAAAAAASLAHSEYADKRVTGILPVAAPPLASLESRPRCVFACERGHFDIQRN